MDLVTKICSGATTLVNYSYPWKGVKVCALKSSGEGLVYRGPFVYRKASDGSFKLESAIFEEGRLTTSGVILHVTDHLGSVVAAVRGSDGALYEASQYDAFGKRSSLTDADTVPLPDGIKSRNGFSGKEDQKLEFGAEYIDFGARQYSSMQRRWMTPDPLSEKYYGSSPYAYCDGDLVNFIDPDGRSWFQNTKTGQIYYNKALLIMSENSNYDSKDWSLLFSNSKYDSLIVRQYDHLCDLNGGFLFDSRVSKQMMSHIRYEFKTTKELVHVKETIMRYPEGMSQISIVQKDDLTENILESRYVPKNANKHTISAKYIKTTKTKRNVFPFPINGEINEFIEYREYSYDFSPEVDTELLKNIIIEVVKTIATSL